MTIRPIYYTAQNAGVSVSFINASSDSFCRNACHLSITMLFVIQAAAEPTKESSCRDLFFISYIIPRHPNGMPVIF